MGFFDSPIQGSGSSGNFFTSTTPTAPATSLSLSPFGNTSQTTPQTPAGSGGGGFLQGLADTVSNFFAGPIDRAKAVYQSVTQGSFAPLKQDIAAQGAEMGAPAVTFHDAQGNTIGSIPNWLHNLAFGAIAEGDAASAISRQLDTFAKFASKTSSESDIAAEAMKNFGLTDQAAQQLGAQLKDMTSFADIKEALKPVSQAMTEAVKPTSEALSAKPGPSGTQDIPRPLLPQDRTTTPDYTPANTSSPGETLPQSAPRPPVSSSYDNIARSIDLSIKGDTPKERIGSAVNNHEYVHNTITTLEKAATRFGSKMSATDFKIVRDQIQALPVDATPAQMEEIARQTSDPSTAFSYMKASQKYYQTEHALNQGAGGSTPYRQNYMTQYWDRSDVKAAEALDILAKKNDPTFTGLHRQPRAFDTYAQGEAATYVNSKGETVHFKPLNANIGEDLKMNAQTAAPILARQTLVQGLKEAAPGEIGTAGVLERNLQGTVLKDYSVSRNLERQLKGFQQLSNVDVIAAARKNGFRASDSSTYGALWSAMKTNGSLNTIGTLWDHSTGAFKSLFLTGTFFHTQNITKNFVGEHAWLNPLKTGEATAESVAAFMSEGHTLALTEKMQQTLPGRDYSSFEWGLKSGIKLDRADPLTGTAKYNPVKVAQRAIFDRQIYTLKLYATDAAAKSGVAPGSPKAIAIGKEITQLMGEINPRTMNWSTATLKWLGRFMLAPQFTISKWSLAARAVSTNPVKTGGTALRAVIGTSLWVGLIATFGTKVMTGNFPNLQQIFFNFTTNPSIQTNLTNPKGQKLDIGFPQTYATEIAKPALGVLKGATGIGPGNPSDVVHYGIARLNPVGGAILSGVTNQDYYGNPIVDPNVKESAAMQRIKNIGGNYLPLGAQAGVKQAQGKTTGVQTAINVAGFSTHVSANDPTSIKYSGIDKAVSDIAAIAPDDPNRTAKMQAVFNSIPVADRKSLQYQELMAGVSTKGIYTSDVEQKYYQVQDLLAKGDTAGATAITQAMSKQDYSTYKSIKTRATNDALYTKVQALLHDGDTAGATKLTQAMTKAQYKSYQTWKKNNGIQ